MKRFLGVFLSVVLFSIVGGVASANNVTQKSAPPTMSGEWSGWWRPQNVMRQGNLTLRVAETEQRITGTMQMHEYVTGDITLRNHTQSPDGRHDFSGEPSGGKSMAVTLQYLEDGNTLYGTAQIGGAVIYLRLFRDKK